MANTICDFCLEESKGLFHRHERLVSGHYICKKCRDVLETHQLPVKYDLFQTLLTADPSMRATLMDNHLQRNDATQCIAKFYPLPANLLHDGEQCINVTEATIKVNPSKLPASIAETRIANITKKDILNLEDYPDGFEIKGTLYETNAAIYFLSKHFINCHRLSHLIKNYPDPSIIYIMNGSHEFSYQVPHSDLFYLRDEFYHKILEKKDNKKQNLIYLSSENTMMITPGSYSVPRNIQPGVYWINPVKDGGIHFSNATGEPMESVGGRIQLDEGDMMEVTGEYEFRFKKKETSPKEEKVIIEDLPEE
ncbi:MAG: hypothetical protein IKE51_04875 [Solobacterium sp.]|nr:hypothetical protein [Solobacterium sp.]